MLKLTVFFHFFCLPVFLWNGELFVAFDIGVLSCLLKGLLIFFTFKVMVYSCVFIKARELEVFA